MKSILLSIIATVLCCSSSFAQVVPDTKEKPQPEQPAATPAAKRARYDVELQRALADREKAEADRAVADQDLVYTRKAFANWKQKLEKGSYLGIATSSIPAVLR